MRSARLHCSRHQGKDFSRLFCRGSNCGDVGFSVRLETLRLFSMGRNYGDRRRLQNGIPQIVPILIVLYR